MPPAATAASAACCRPTAAAAPAATAATAARAPSGVGGGIFNATTGTLTLKPRLGAKKGSSQAKATDVITTNQALAATGGHAGAGGTATGGLGRPAQGFNGLNGVATPGQPGVTDLFSAGVGGGIATFGTAFVDNTTISGNQASTSDPNVDGNAHAVTRRPGPEPRVPGPAHRPSRPPSSGAGGTATGDPPGRRSFAQGRAERR